MDLYHTSFSFYQHWIKHIQIQQRMKILFSLQFLDLIPIRILFDDPLFETISVIDIFDISSIIYLLNSIYIQEEALILHNIIYLSIPIIILIPIDFFSPLRITNI